MQIYPAMDLMDGQIVRLRQGRFDDSTLYGDNAEARLEAFAEAGAEWAHIVDLDGARAGEPVQHDRIAALARSTGLKVQAAGGVRTREHVEALLEAGVSRVVVGSMCVKDPDAVSEWLESFGCEHIAAAMDVRMVDEDPMVAVSGWEEDSGVDLWTALAAFPEGALKHVLATDVARDGEMSGPSVALSALFRDRRPDLALMASGGVRDVSALKALAAEGSAGAIVGKAIYEGRLDLKEAIDACASDHPLP